MRIAILTQPLRYNYGGILQNFALQTVLRRMGHDVVTLDPHRFKYSFWKHLLRIACHIIGRYVLGHHNNSILKEWRTDKVVRILGTNTFGFIDKYINRREYRDLSKEILPNDFDAFVVGSDQVWRHEYNTNLSNMFLDFTYGWNVGRIAYAASFGLDQWNCDKETTERCKELLQHFDLITIRESSGVKLCQNVFETEAIHVLDPTLLLTKEDYCSLLHLNRVPPSKGNLLVYILDYTEDKLKLIQSIKEKYQLKPFRVNSDYEDRSLSDLSRRIQPPVEQWLRSFYDADYVVTDSYHGCIFSIIFGKSFVVYANVGRGRTRFESLLCQLSLSDCMISSFDEFHGFNDNPLIGLEIVEELRKSSRETLSRTLQHVVNENA